MRLYKINANLYKVDGGAYFGVVPQPVWSKLQAPDEMNRCTIATRCLLVEVMNRLILIDTGMGNKQSEKFFNYHQQHGTDDLRTSLAIAGFHPNDVTDVILTHLHFDHCGGAVNINESGELVPYFKNAIYWSNKQHWQWALEGNEREKHSFLKENILPIEDSGQLRFLNDNEYLVPEVQVKFVYGHTLAMMVPYIRYKDWTIVYVSDLIPSIAHISLPFVMAYDINPLQTIAEKRALLEKASHENYVLFFEHDPNHECCTVKPGIKYPEAGRVFALEELTEVSQIQVS